MKNLGELKTPIYRGFKGIATIRMPLLLSGRSREGYTVDVPREPASFADVIKLRMENPKDSLQIWRGQNIYTIDASVAGAQKDHLVVLDAKLLHELTRLSEYSMYDGALLLDDGVWDELKAHKDTTLYLTAEEVVEAEGKGYIKKEGIWIPANRTVGKVWEHLGRGVNLQSYAQFVSEEPLGIELVMNIYFNSTSKDSTARDVATMRPWVAPTFDNCFPAIGYESLNSGFGYLVGIAKQD